MGKTFKRHKSRWDDYDDTGHYGHQSSYDDDWKRKKAIERAQKIKLKQENREQQYHQHRDDDYDD